MTVRRFQSLLAGLPPDSSVIRSFEPERLGVGWGFQEELLASLAELVDQTNRLIFATNAKKGTRIPDPIFIPRPGPRPEKRNATADELMAMFGDQGVSIKVVGEKGQ
jgi:hypothetical protein